MIELNENLSFDEAYAQLEEAVRALENPDLKFEESMALYEKASALMVYCQRKLTDATQRIAEIDDYVRQFREADGSADELIEE